MTQSIINLTPSQNLAFEKIKSFLSNDEPAICINGSAGVGKSTLMTYVVDYIRTTLQLSIGIIAPTHKARRVILEMLNKNNFIKIEGYTIASILGKIKEHSYIGTKKFSGANTSKMENYNLFILDEVSMVCDKDLDMILEYICNTDKKIILIGDNCQIPSPAQQIVKKDLYCYKPDSYAFDIENIITLNEIVRQKKDSYIIKIATYLRDNLKRDSNITDMLDNLKINPDDVLIKNDDDLYKRISDDILLRKMTSKIVTYTNEQVKTHNIRLRRALGRIKPFNIGEVLVGYNSSSTIIENGSEYVVSDLAITTTKKIVNFSDLAGTYLTLKNVVDEKDIHKVFALDVVHPNNVSFLNRLVALAEKVNVPRSTPEDFRNYIKIKKHAVFIDDIYKYENNIVNEQEFKKMHPLLFIKVLEVINDKDKTIIVNDTSRAIEEYYPSLIEDRINDTKGYADTEVFADKYKIIEKDLYYGYAITSHKAQGSTYDAVYVDENDFTKIRDRWNHRYRCMELRVREKNQLRYVAYTRASSVLKIIY